MKAFILSTCLTLSIYVAFAQSGHPDTIPAYFTTQKITLDGKLDENVWSNATKITNFTQRELEEGNPGSEKTKIAVLYSTNVLYIGFWGYDSDPSKIVAKEMSRDFDFDSEDNFEFIISTFNDNRNGYLFVTNPNGARADILILNEGESSNRDWNGVWDVETTVTDEGWFAEVEIPFSTLKFPKTPVQSWGINFERNIRRKREQLLWQGWYRIYELEKISQAGTLVGLKEIRAKNRVELLPYISAGMENIRYDDESDEVNKKWKNKSKTGGDINMDITPTLKLNLTANTDFSQVESDQDQINLSRFNIDYPEKRQFFLEGKNLFEMNLDGNHIFNSRKIGINDEEAVPVWGGIRIFGKQNKTNIGVLSIQTADKDSIPTMNHSVIRIRQDVGKQSSVGVIATSRLEAARYNYVYGADFMFSTSKLFDNKNLVIYAALAQSQTTDSSTLNNLGYNAYLAYHNDIIEFDLSVEEMQKNFNPELGFLRKENYRMYSTELQFNPRPKSMLFFRNLVFKPIEIQYYVNSETNVLELMEYEWRPIGFTSRSGESMELNVKHVIDRIDGIYNIYDTIHIPEDTYQYNRMELKLESFRGRRLSGELELEGGEYYTGHRTRIETEANWNINRHWNINAFWERNYVFLDSQDFITDELGGRVTYAYNPKLNSGIFGQWNTEDEELLFNYRINWIPKIGSDFYFVINQALSTENYSLKILRTTVLAKLIWRFAL